MMWRNVSVDKDAMVCMLIGIRDSHELDNNVDAQELISTFEDELIKPDPEPVIIKNHLIRLKNIASDSGAITSLKCINEALWML